MKFSVYRFFITILIAASIQPLLLLSACSGQQVSELPAWVVRASETETGDVPGLSQRMAGHWVLSEGLSDDPRQIIEEAFKSSKLFRNKRGPASRDERGRPSMRGAQGMAGHMPPGSGPDDNLNDPRLQALFARELQISFVDEKLVYRYLDMEPDRQTEGNPGKKPEGKPGIRSPGKPHGEPENHLTTYPIYGTPISLDGNINIAFAEWEREQFVIERNGPRGRILEYWTPSPDARQLHLSIQMALPMLPEVVTINRVFDARQ